MIALVGALNHQSLVAMVVQEVGCLRCSAQDGGGGNIQNVRLGSSQSGSGIFCRGPKVIMAWQQICDIKWRMVYCNRFSADEVSVNVTLVLVPEDDGVRVTDVLISVDLDKMTLEMECLFPRNGKCCPRKYLKSCNTILTKTILRYSKL